MTPEKQAEFAEALKSAEPTDALTLALILAVCHDQSVKTISAEQRKDILLAALDAHKVMVIYEIMMLLVRERDGHDPTAAEVVGRVKHAGIHSANTIRPRLERFFNLCEMLKQDAV